MKLLLVVAVVLIAFASAFTLYFLFNTKTSTAVMTLSSSEIATQSSLFLDSLRKDNGEYFVIKNCEENSTYKGCVTTNVFSDTKANAWPLIAYTSLYKIAGNSTYLQKAQKDMQILSNYCSSNQNCIWILVQMLEYQKVSGDKQYSSLIANLGQQLLTNSQNNSTMLLGIEARELAMLYEMNGQQQYLDQAKIRLQESKNLWQNNSADQLQAWLYTDSGQQFYGFACWTELAEIEIYQASHDSSYLTNAMSFFDAANVDKHSRTIEQLVALQPCIDSLLKLNSITGNSKYFSEAENASQYVITYRWDPNIPIAEKYNGDGGFLWQLYQNTNTKDVTDTSYMIYLLSQMPNQQFYILRWN